MGVLTGKPEIETRRARQARRHLGNLGELITANGLAATKLL
jgi:hypothetical protein